MRICLGFSKSMEEAGFKSVDIQGTPDIVDNAFELNKIKDGSCDVIIASHVLEHAPYSGTASYRTGMAVNILKLWYTKLKDGGSIYISVPDFDFIIVHYMKIRETFWDYAVDIVGPLFGGGANIHDSHKMIFNRPIMRYIMENAGFVDINDLPHGSPEFLPEFNGSSLDRRGFNIMGVKKKNDS